MKRWQYVVTWMEGGIVKFYLSDKRRDAVAEAKRLMALGFLVDITKQ